MTCGIILYRPLVTPFSIVTPAFSAIVITSGTQKNHFLSLLLAPVEAFRKPVSNSWQK